MTIKTPAAPRKPAARAAPQRRTVLTLKARECRWPIGEPRHEDFHFCGKPQAPGRPYCDTHWAASRAPATARPIRFREVS
jgi:GcrA cell cycle regulator